MRVIAFYTLCAVPLACLVAGLLNVLPWRYLNGITVVALLAVILLSSGREKQESLMSCSVRISPIAIIRNRCPKDVPGAYWRRVRRLRLWAVLCSFAWLGSGVVLLFLAPDKAITLGFLAMWGVCLAVFGVAPRYMNTSLQRKVRENQFRVCKECEYILTLDPSTHRCSECGTSFEGASLQAEWEAWFSDRDREKKRGHSSFSTGCRKA